MKPFAERYGFERAQATLGNWREQPYSRWSFQHVGEIVPSAVVRTQAPEAAGEIAAPLDDRRVEVAGSTVRLADFLAASHADLFLLARPGEPLRQWAGTAADPHLPHIVFSISKSVTGLLAGILAAQGLLDTEKPVAHYLPAMRASAYGDCSLRNVLDMRVGLDFKEDYLDRTGAYARYRRAMGWNPDAGEPAREGLADVLASLGKTPQGHGGAFQYQSPNADLAALVLEAAAGARFADLMSALLWRPMQAQGDAYITVDRYGAPRGSGGISMTAGDLLSIGRLLVEGGAREGQQVLPEAWLAAMLKGGDSAAWNAGSFAAFMPGGSYRDFWYCCADGAVAAIGIHGQWLYANPSSGAVAVWLASQPVPQDDRLDAKILSALAQLTA